MFRFALAVILAISAPGLTGCVEASLALAPGQECEGPASVAQAPGQCGSFGSGFFVSTQGDVVTNWHVVNGCNQLAVRGSNGVVYLAQLVSRDPAHDLAVLRVIGDVPATAVLNLTPPQSTQQVAAVGFPDNRDTRQGPTAAYGIVVEKAQYTKDASVVAFSALIAQGNSGGPLIDMAGHVVGVVYGRYNLARDVYFAVQAKALARLIDGLGIRYESATQSPRTDPDTAYIEAAKYTVYVQCLC